MTLDVGSRRELFVDHYLVERLEGAGLRLRGPRREGVAIRLDDPWEGPLSGYFTVIDDGERYRAYYRGWPAFKAAYGGAVTCYAESGDGANWEKPELGICEVMGTRANNVILDDPLLAVSFSPFLDTRPDVPSSEHLNTSATQPYFRAPTSTSPSRSDSCPTSRPCLPPKDAPWSATRASAAPPAMRSS